MLLAVGLVQNDNVDLAIAAHRHQGLIAVSLFTFPCPKNVVADFALFPGLKKSGGDRPQLPKKSNQARLTLIFDRVG